MGTSADVGMRRRDKRWRLSSVRRQSASRWLALHNKRLGEERVKFRWIERGTSTDGEEVGKRVERTIQKTGEEKGGAEGLD